MELRTLAHQNTAFKEFLGSTILEAFGSSEILEVLRNPDGSLWQDHREKGLSRLDADLSDERAAAFIRHVAGLQGLAVTYEEPILETEFPLNGSRLTAVMPPAVTSTAFAIRKHATKVYPLSDYIKTSAIGPDEAAFLRRVVAPTANEESTGLFADTPIIVPALSASRADLGGRPLNILISGGPGSGKTTLANALIREMSRSARKTERILLLEDTFELRCEARCHVQLHTTETVDLRRLVRLAMRLRPDRLVIGEVLGGEALELLKAWNTGVPGGVATVHANSAAEALYRLEQLVQEAAPGPQRGLVASAVDIVAHIERRPNGRRLTHLLHVQGLDESGDFLVLRHSSTPFKGGTHAV